MIAPYDPVAQPLAVRLEKLRFLVEELQLAYALARAAPNSAGARMLSRHAIVRAENFIEHARAIRKPLNSAGFDTAEFNRTKENYAEAFFGYFAVVRHRLGAHVQDLDFAHRIEIWSDIDKGKIDFLVSGARDIYELLDGLAVPGYRHYEQPPELSDTAVALALHAFGEEAGTGSVEMATDSLALTRPNTLAMLNSTPVHARAAQISLLRRWTRNQAAAFEHFQDFPRLARIFKARLVTDVVSLYDCLITRPVSAQAPQAMKGLDELLREDEQPVWPVERFLEISTDQIAPARLVRDRIGAHLESEVAVTAADLLRELDEVPLDDLLRLFGALEELFLKLCRTVIYLMPYLSDGQEVRGGTLARPTGAAPFDGDWPDAEAAGPERLAFGDAEYERNLASWLGDDPAERSGALAYFNNAFSASAPVETFLLEEVDGPSTRYHHLELRSAHLFILRSLRNADDGKMVDAIAALLSECANGYPTQLTEILVRYLEGLDKPVSLAIVRALGELAPWWHQRARSLLERELDSSDAENAIWSRLAMFRIFIADEGLYRINKKQSRWDYPAFEKKLFFGLSAHGQLLIALSLLSRFSSRALDIYAKPFVLEREGLAAKLEQLLAGIGSGLDAGRTANLRDMVQHQTFATLALLISEWLAEGEADLAKDLRRWVCAGAIVTANSDFDRRHQAILLQPNRRSAGGACAYRGLGAPEPRRSRQSAAESRNARSDRGTAGQRACRTGGASGSLQDWFGGAGARGRLG